jgi:hypothetical protein
VNAENMNNVDLIGELQRLLQVLPMVEYQRDLITYAIVKLSEKSFVASGDKCEAGASSRHDEQRKDAHK